MSPMPKDTSPDSTLALLMEGYHFIATRCENHNSDIFATRLMMEDFICMRGEAAARLFYDRERFARAGVTPDLVQDTLFGRGGVQGLDDEAHRHRKQIFMSLMTPENIQRLVGLVDEAWGNALVRWEDEEQMALLDTLHEVLCRAACRWAEVPLGEDEVNKRTDDMAAMIDSSGSVGLRHWRGKHARDEAERWIGGIVAAVRAGELQPSEGSACRLVAQYRDRYDQLLDEQVAAVEILNILRPIVAISRFLTFAALALHDHPECRARLMEDNEPDYPELFVQEVRRFYPFFPFLAARVRETFQWQGFEFPLGRKVLLDIYGTNRHPGLWPEPEAFRPERFREWNGSAFNFIPQGGGDHYHNHRCPGEWITIEVMKLGVRWLTRGMRYQIPEQDLQVRMSRLPALPKSRFLISGVQRLS